MEYYESYPLNRQYQSEHSEKNLQDVVKFKAIFKKRHSSTLAASNDQHIEHEQKEYVDLERKLADKEKMVAGNRTFNKSFYSKLSKKIVQKPISFFKFGLRDEERKSCKTAFSELFKVLIEAIEIESKKLKGTLSVNDIWDNETIMKYLKENDMFFNKEILINQFRTMDKERKQKRKEMEEKKEKEFIAKYKIWEKENQLFNLNNLNYQETKNMNMKEACEFIRTEIQQLIHGNRDRGRRNLGDRKSTGEAKVQNKYVRDKSYSRKIIRSLEKDYDSYDKIACKFKDKMIVLL